MRISFILFSLLFSVSIFAQIPALMPMPEKIIWSDEHYTIHASLSIRADGTFDPRLFKAMTRFKQRVAERTGVFMKTWVVDDGNMPVKASLQIQVEGSGVVKLDMDESYSLKVSRDGILIRSATDIGAIRALETLFQLISFNDNSFFFHGVDLTDKPRFSWRGLLIAQPYHFLPMDAIKRTLDAMCLVKLNVLHFYLSDDQAYTIESKKYPVLHQKASLGQYFTHEQIKEIVDYADERGIRVVPELDLPGHSTAILSLFPHLASLEKNYDLQDHWGVFDPVMDPTKESTYQFLDTLLTEVAGLFKDPYFHIGGDENTGKHWAQNDSIQRFMKNNNLNSTVALQNYFNKRVQQILSKSGKTTVAWDEIIMQEIDGNKAKEFFEKGQYDALILKDVPKDMVIQSWRGMEALLSSAKNGYRSILSKGYYIDLVQPASYHYLNDPVPAKNTQIIPDSEANFDRFESEIIKKIKGGDPLLTPEEEKFIIGGEATMWTEHTTPETVDARIWPRTAAIAERLWSPANLRDVNDMYRRMDQISIQLEWVGATHLKNPPMMLRRLSGQEDILPLQKVIGLIEPLKGYKRNELDNFTKFSPYTQVVDVAVPDPPSLRKSNKIIDEATMKNLSSLIEMLKMWKENHSSVLHLAKGNPLLEPVIHHSASLQLLASAMLEFIELKEKGSKVGGNWHQNFDLLIEKSSKPNGYCELMVVEALKQFVLKNR